MFEERRELGTDMRPDPERVENIYGNNIRRTGKIMPTGGFITFNKSVILQVKIFDVAFVYLVVFFLEFRDKDTV